MNGVISCRFLALASVVSNLGGRFNIVVRVLSKFCQGCVVEIVVVQSVPTDGPVAV